MLFYSLERDIEAKHIKRVEGNLFSLITQRVVMYLSFYNYKEELQWRIRFCGEEPVSDENYKKWYEFFTHVVTTKDWNRQVGWDDFAELNTWMLRD